MTPDAATVLVARSRPKVVALLALGAVTIFLTYLGLSAFDTSLPMIGPRRLGRPAKDLAVLFLVIAAVSLATTVWQIWRRLIPNVDVIADAEGIASQQSFWGRGRLAWSEITRLESKYYSLLYIHGISATGDTKRLVIDTRQIDVPAADLFAVIARHRPDLVSKPRS
jgi:uncharacterized membrane protein